MTGFTVWDWATVGAFLCVMVWIGYRSSRRMKTGDDYALGGRSMNPVMVGISLFATLLSTLSYLAYPGEMIKYGPICALALTAFPVAYWIVSRFLIPRFMEMRVTSAYEILEIRLGRGARVLATVFFLSLRFLWMSTILYATVSIALLPILELDPKWIPLASLVLTAITVLYTTLGGIRAVVTTDVIQSGIMFAGVLLTIGLVLAKIGSFDVFTDPDLYAHWGKLRFGIDATDRMTFGNIFIMTLLWQVCTAGSDQMSIQRYLSTRDTRSAIRSYRVSMISSGTIQVLLALVGLAVMAYFTIFPEQMAAGTTISGNADTLFPRFILIGLPPGITGLIAAAIMAAAMSSVSSGLNSSAVVIQQDILKHVRKHPSPTEGAAGLRNIRRICGVLGIVVAGCAYLISFVSGNLLDITFKVVNLVTAPLFVLFFMALFVPFATNRGTVFGGLCAMTVAVLIAFWGVLGISPLWIPASALVTGIATGVAFSWVESRLRRA